MMSWCDLFVTFVPGSVRPRTRKIFDVENLVQARSLEVDERSMRDILTHHHALTLV